MRCRRITGLMIGGRILLGVIDRSSRAHAGTEKKDPGGDGLREFDMNAVLCYPELCSQDCTLDGVGKG